MPYNDAWKRTMDDFAKQSASSDYDALIQKEVSAYNVKFVSSPGFASLNWKLFKAMAWVESGGSVAWKMRTMQIGNPKDEGYPVLKSGAEASLLIMSEQLARDIKTGNISEPTLNIRAGIAYALNRVVRSDIKSVDDPTDPIIKEYAVMPGEIFMSIARKLHTTKDSLDKLNPTAKILKIGQKIKWRKAKMQRVIIGWHVITTAKIASTYNAKDPNYQQKLDYVLTLL